MQGICSDLVCLCVGVLFNPLTTDNTIWHCLILAACYHQLAQYTWQLPWLAEPFVIVLAEMGIGTIPFSF